MPRNESDFTKRFCRRLENLGALVFPIVAHPRQHPGWPDRVIIARWWSGLLEFKGPRTAVRPLQRIIGGRIRERDPDAAYVLRADSNDGESGRLQDFDGNDIFSFDSVETLVEWFRRPLSDDLSS